MPLLRDPRDPGENSGRLYSMCRRVQIDTFARNWASNFRKIRENRPGHPKAPQGSPRDPQGIPKGSPRDPKGHPRGPKGPMGPQRRSRAAQREPSGSQIEAKGTPKPVHGQPKQAKRTNYINKLPINRLRGRYVNCSIDLYIKIAMSVIEVIDDGTAHSQL